MKKLIAVAVVFALATGGLFAADIGVDVFGSVQLMKGNNTKDIDQASMDKGSPKEVASPVYTGGTMNRLRFDASGGNDQFGGWIRLDNGSSSTWKGIAWWKPIDQFKMNIGGNPDGVYGRDNGATGWGFYQLSGEIGISNNGNTWGGGYWTKGGVMRDAFFSGYEINGMSIEITPVEQFTLVLGLPLFSGGQWKDQFQAVMIQGLINLDFGQIGITYKGDRGVATDNKKGDADFKTTGKFYVDADIGAIENIGLNVGVAAAVPGDVWVGSKKGQIYDQISVGVGADMALSDTFGLKARLLAQFGGGAKNDKGEETSRAPLFVGLDLNPNIAVSDELKVFISLGMGLVAPHQVLKNNDSKKGVWITEKKPYGKKGKLEDDKGTFSWHFNPYVMVGSGWMPHFFAGVRIWGDNVEYFTPVKGDPFNKVNFEVPIGIVVGF